jgi:hypothetical protein
MADFWTIKCKGGPKHGTRCIPVGLGGLQWPLPETLSDDGGIYRKVSESQFPDDSATHVSRGAEYVWQEAT